MSMHNRHPLLQLSPFAPPYREAGQHALLLAVLMPMLIAGAGLLADGGRMLVEYRRAQIAIDGAAFAAAQRVDRSVFFNNQAVILQAGEAVAIGGLYGSLNSSGAVRVTSIEVNGGYVIARGYFETEPLFLGLFGMGRVHKNLTSLAVPSYGIFRETQ